MRLDSVALNLSGLETLLARGGRRLLDRASSSAPAEKTRYDAPHVLGSALLTLSETIIAPLSLASTFIGLPDLRQVGISDVGKLFSVAQKAWKRWASPDPGQGSKAHPNFIPMSIGEAINIVKLAFGNVEAGLDLFTNDATVRLIQFIRLADEIAAPEKAVEDLLSLLDNFSVLSTLEQLIPDFAPPALPSAEAIIDTNPEIDNTNI